MENIKKTLIQVSDVSFDIPSMDPAQLQDFVAYYRDRRQEIFRNGATMYVFTQQLSKKRQMVDKMGIYAEEEPGQPP